MPKRLKPATVFFALFLLMGSAVYGPMGYSQTREAGSLKMLVLRAPDPNQRMAAYIKYFEVWYNVQRDTLYQYAADAYAQARKNGNSIQLASSALALSRSYMHWGWIDSAIGFLQPEVSKGPANIPPRLFLEMNRQLALAHGGGSRYSEALDLLYHNCRFAETNKDMVGFAASANTIVSVLLSMGRLNDVPLWLQRARGALGGTPEPAPHVLAAIFTNFGGYYLAVKKTTLAGTYLDSAMTILDEHENLSIRPILLRHRAKYYLGLHNTEQAGNMLQEMIAARTLIAGSFSFIEEKLEMARFYEQNGFLNEAIKICEDNLMQGDVYDTAKHDIVFNNDIKNRLPYYTMLVDLYKKAGQKEKYTETLEWLVAAKDSFYSHNNAEAIAELQAKYELSEKEKALAQQKIEIWRKNLLLYAGGGLAVLVIGGMLYGFVRYRKKQRRQMEAAMAKEKAKAELAQREATEHERRRIAADLHDNLGAYGAAIKSNLGQIQRQDHPARLPLQQIEENVQHMVDELGNTIWVLNALEQNLTALYDKLKTWTGRLMNSYPGIRCRFEENLETDVVLNPKQALNWLYIMQEAINNAVKHSGGSLVTVTLFCRKNWEIIVADNGNGMTAGNEDGHGLKSITGRAERMGWGTMWNPEDTGGTRFCLSAKP